MDTNIINRIKWASLILVVILFVGSLGYWLIGGRHDTFLNVLYMTFITITTIGFHEIVDMSSHPAGRVFTMLVAISGIGVIAYIATNATALLIEGELTKSFRNRKMQKKAREQKDHYIICGISGVGNYIMAELSDTKRSFVVIDKDDVQVDKAIENSSDIIIINGDATDENVLVKSGIHAAKGLFAVTNDDNQNLVISLTAKQINPRLKVIARCNDTANVKKLKKAGADSVISPNEIGGLRMASDMIRPTVVSFLDIMLRDRDLNLRVEEITIPASFKAQSIRTLGLKDHSSILVLAINDGNHWVYNPSGDYSLKPQDTVIFMGAPDSRHELQKILS